MQMQHLMVGYPKYYQTADYALRLSVMADIATMRMKALHFWDKHGISAAYEAFGVSCRTLYWWRQLLNKEGPEGLIPHSKAPLVRRKKHWHPDVLKEIRRLRTELPNLGKEQIFVRLKPWCEQRYLACPSVSTIGRMIAAAHDKMRMIPVRLGSRGKALLVKKRSAKPRRPKHYRPVKTGELIGMDAIELRMGELRRYVITMIDECSNYALALAVPSLNSDIVNHFFSRAARLFPVGISQIITDNGKEFLGNFDKTLQEAAIKHLWTYPYTPKMNAICERFNRTLREQFIEFNEILLFEDLALFNQKLAEYLVLYNSKRPHKALALMTPVEYILKENKNCNMWWTHTMSCLPAKKRLTFELFGFERKPQVDRNIAWGFCPSGTSRMLNARQPQAPDAILYLIILPAAFTFKIRNTARKIKTPPSFLTEAFNLSGNIYPSCNPHSLFKPKKRVSSSDMPGSHLRVVWVSPTDKYPSSHNG